MKHLHKLLFTFCIIFSTAQPYEWQPCPDTTFLAFDIDDVVAESLKCELTKLTLGQNANLVLGGMWYEPTNSHNWLQSLLKIDGCYQRDADGKKEDLYDEDGNAINGLAFHFLYHGMRDTNLAHYVPWIVNNIEGSRVPIQGTIEICRYLKEKKGYTLVFATNKCRPSFDAFARSIGPDVTNLPERIFVAHSGNSEALLRKIKAFAQRKDTPKNYKQFAYEALTVQPTEHIKHVPHVKPYIPYYAYVHATTQKELNKQHMIFIDDKKLNIDSVEDYANKLTDGSRAAGIHFKNPYQLIQELLKYGILSPTTDKAFLRKMNKYK